MAKTKKENDTAAVVNAVTIAEKQRLRLLLTKINQDQALTKAELDEFKHLESKYMSPSDGKAKAKVAFAESQILRTRQNAAKYAGVCVRTIGRWVKGGMMRTDRDYYIKSQLDIFKQNEGQAPNEHKVRVTKASADVKEVQAELLKMDLVNRQKKYHSVEECLQRDIARILAVKRALMGMGRKMAQQFPKKQRRKIQAVCNQEARNICDNFAEGRG